MLTTKRSAVTRHDTAIYLLGTNYIKIGKDGKREADQLINTVERSGIATNKFIIELPPINRKGKETERRIFNYTLHQNTRTKNIRIIRIDQGN